MTPKVTELLASAMALSAAEREELADCLWSSLDPPDVVKDHLTEDEFVAELNRRAAELRTNPSLGLSWDEFGTCGERLMGIVFHRLAAQEFVKARRWYGRRSAQAEARFVNAVADALTFIETNPLLAPTYQGNHRWQRVRRFPYVIYFEPLAGGNIHVYAVGHARRRPGYWLRRVTRP